MHLRAEHGTIIYVVEADTWLHYLCLNYLLLFYHLPLASACFGLSVAPYNAVAWPLWWLYRLISSIAQSKEEVALQRRQAIFDELRTGRAVCIPIGPGDNSGNEAWRCCQGVAPLLQDILALQRSLPFPLVMCPLHVAWSRKPLRRASAASKRSYADRVFGTRERPGLLRAAASMLFDRRRFVQVGGGAPINLSEWMLSYRAAAAPTSHAPDPHLARQLVSLLHGRFAARWLQATGPPPLPRKALMDRVLTAPRVRRAIASAAASGGRCSEEEYAQLAGAVAQRASSGVRAWLMRLLHALLRWLLPLCFRAAYLDEAGLAAIQRAAFERGCPIVYVPTVADSWQAVVVSFVCHARDLAAPVLCGGQTLARLLQESNLTSWLKSGLGAPIAHTAEEAAVARAVWHEFVVATLEHGFNLELPVCDEGNLAMACQSEPRLSVIRQASHALPLVHVPDLGQCAVPDFVADGCVASRAQKSRFRRHTYCAFTQASPSCVPCTRCFLIRRHACAAH